MNVRDENVPDSQGALLRRKGVAFRQIGQELGRLSMGDEEIIALLHQLDRPTFFTLDGDFYDRGLCHKRYCLAYLDIEEATAAEYVRRVLRHRRLNTRAKRMGSVIRVSPDGLVLWRIHQEQKEHLAWE